MFVIMIRTFLFLLLLGLSQAVLSQPIATGLSDLLQEIRGLEKETRVLYLAAHPDDENTRLISWLTHGAGTKTAYLSLTRGDGGQNLVGPELGAPLGFIRTQELLEARKIDGGYQFFSRAVDFGYSKNPEETFKFWGKNEVLSDVVYVIRKFQPHIIITRFPPDGRGGHGHHTASAILAEEAFDLSNDPNAFPEQLNSVELWQPEMLYWNASSWWDRELPNKAKTDPTIVEIEVGGYDPILGMSCNELASMSRSMHKSQGFGMATMRGEMQEYLEFRKGNNNFYNRLFPEPVNDDQLASHAQMASYFLINGRRDEAINQLFQLRDQSGNAERTEKIDRIIVGILGIYAEANTPNWFITKGETAEIDLNCLLRLDYPVSLSSVNWNGEIEVLNQEMVRDQSIELKHSLLCDESTNPYWLNEPFDALFNVPDSLIGFAQNPIMPFVELKFQYESKSFSLKVPLQYKWTDRVAGEQKRPFIVSPVATVKFEDASLVTTGKPVNVALEVKGWKDGVSDNLRFDLPDGWRVKPSFIPIDLPKAGDVQRVEVTLYPPSGTQTGVLRPKLDLMDEDIKDALEINYDHIIQEVLFLPSELKLANAQIVIDAGTVGYIEGAGDAVPQALERMGFQVEMITEEQIRSQSLDKYMAIVAGIRAYNVNEWLPDVQDKLMKYVEDGGNFIVQYNTRSRDLKLQSFGPYPMKLSRERVSEEKAKANIVDPTHGIFNYPNRISEKDFDNWVQERGLYFADVGSLDQKYETLISWHDKDEPPRLGGLIVANHGDGSFIYTGISFFRQLPAAVPGAYRLMANMICYEP